MKRTYYGKAGHFCASDDCRFHLHTHVGGYCVSTVGDYRPKDAKGKQESLTADPLALYETMAFRLEADGDINAGKPLVTRHYANPEAADAGHEGVVRKYEAAASEAAAPDLLAALEELFLRTHNFGVSQSRSNRELMDAAKEKARVVILRATGAAK